MEVQARFKAPYLFARGVSIVHDAKGCVRILKNFRSKILRSRIKPLFQMEIKGLIYIIFKNRDMQNEYKLSPEGPHPSRDRIGHR